MPTAAWFCSIVKIKDNAMKHALLLLIYIFSYNLVIGQVNSSSGLLGNYGPPSPEASSLGKYIDHPVGFYTGTPIINIPFFEITSGRIKVPISLSYHASGVKVDEIASRVGTGFSLNAGGVVSTVVKGGPDDGIGGGYFSPYNTSINGNVFQFGAVSTGQDLEPDAHYYSFGAKQGKIYFKDKNTPFTINNDPIKILGPYNGDKRFVITTEEGIIYKFEAEEGVQQITTSGTSGTLYTSNSYYLTEIEDPTTSNKIKFIYRIDMPNSIGYSYKRSFTTTMLNCNPSSTPLVNSGSNILNAKVLQKIEYTGGFIEFKADHNREDLIGDRAYTEINQYVYENQSAPPILKKGFNLGYSYTTSGSTVEGKRLYLEFIKEKGTDGSFLPPYAFSYKNRDALPPRNSYQQDIWGFYNANNQTTEGLPKVYLHYNPFSGSGKISYLPFPTIGQANTSVLPGVERSSNPLTMDYGVLNKIIYPTKGYTTYEYEPHQFSYQGIHGYYSFQQGGIRIKEIKDFSAEGEMLLDKSYSYSVGHLGGALPQVAVPTSYANSYFRFYQNQSLLGSTQGSYVGYSDVDEVVKDKSNKKSATRYFYSSDPDVEGSFYVHYDYCSDFNNLTEIRRDTFFPFFEMESREARRGILVKQEFFRDLIVIQKEQPVKRIEYSYNLWSRPMITVGYSYMIGDGVMSMWGTRSLNQEKMLLTSKIETDYFASGDSILRQTDYTYTAGNQDGQFIRTESRLGSDFENSGTIITTIRYTYPFDYAPTASGGTMGKMVSLNYINPAISEIRFNTRATPGSGFSTTCTDAKITSYADIPVFLRPHIKEIFQLKSPIIVSGITDPLVNVSDPANPGINYESRLSYLEYDSYSNPILVLSDKVYYRYNWNLVGQLLYSNKIPDRNDFTFDRPPQSWDLVHASDERRESGYYVWNGVDVSNSVDIPHLLEGTKTTTISFWAKDGDFWIGSSNQEWEGIGGVAPGTWTYYSFSIPSMENAGWVDATISFYGTAKVDEFIFSTGLSETTKYSYDTFNRLKDKIANNGVMESYEYDPFSRLKNVKDDKGNIIKSYDYHFKL